jgi:hypothetical protein
MSEYRTLFGKAVKALASDPTDTGAEGQIWYNTTTGSFRTVLSVGSWTSSANLPTGRDYGTAGGIQTAGFIAGGELGPGTVINTTFDYDGSSWTASGAMGTTRQRMNLGVSGTQTAGLGVGGMIPSTVYSAVEEYNGSIWTAGTSLPVATQQSGGAGPETSYMMLGTPSDRSEGLSYNGSAWSAEGSSSEGFAYGALAGQETAALAFYGATSPAGTPRGTGEEYNGTAWTTIVPSLPNQGNSGGAGGTTSAAVFSGAGTTARYWNGTTVAATTSMATPRANYGSIGGPPGIFVAAGGNGDVSATEEFSFSIYSPIAATWASGTAVNTGRYNGYSTASSPPNALLFFGGITGVPGASTNTAKTEEFNGSTWSEQTDMPTATTTGGTGGLQTAAISMGGYQGPSLTASCFSYNGSSWGSIPSLPTATGNTKGCGTSTAGLLAGGKNPGSPSGTTATFEYDGASWASGGAMTTPRWQCAVYGTQTAAVASGGQGFISTTEEYGGASWTSGGALITASGYLGSNGAQTDGLVYGGETSPGKLSQCVGYDGTAYSTRPSMATARAAVGNGGGDTSTTAVAISGDTPQTPSAMTTAVEEFTGEIPALDYKTITTS